MRTVSVIKARNHLDLLLEWVRQGEEVLLLDRGVPVARLGPVPQAQDESLSLLVRKGLVRSGTGRPEL
ncbi:antitoxin of toxin-antitoxin stability system (plasmid) [Thermus oshimai JL-2]|uniref:Antitoxin of toxin-antitoxin stability system n=1 Tax=Thermus oshimai JL-2 TaxID=751945 RepID=K7R1W5_THEOS|nr:type II toxin-antitoxin system Phd/YefM family antitoxin [Thermus oshimai]AFV77280.1 antitoxin of toxin-antitoxin stability system [Thermus oshimai JL-2]